MNILIIGSNGFIGSNAKSYFANLGYKVYSADVTPNYAEQNYFQITTIETDIPNIFRNNKFDICLNCAGSANVNTSLKNNLNDFILNTHLVYIILNAIKENQRECKFINLSSAAVYGNPIETPIGEKELAKPISPYGFHKYYAEQICKEFNEIYNIKTCSLRIFSAYGNGLNKQLFWDIYHRMNSNSKEIVLYGTGNESRDFIHIFDILQSLNIIMQHSNFNADSINIANGEEILIKNAVETFAKLFNWEGKIIFNNQIRAGDPQNWKADITIIKSLGYQQSIRLEEGLSKYIQWIKEKK